MDKWKTLKGINYFEKSWGYEIWFANTKEYCGKELYVRNHLYSSKGNFHYHKNKDETFYVIEGKLKLDYVDNEGDFRSIILEEDQSFRVYPMIKHRFTSISVTGCRFIEASTHHEESDSYRCYFDEKLNKWIDIENELQSGSTQLSESQK
jgi:mannose-6-phosphate isomerase-like protein (cupin superfamily)